MFRTIQLSSRVSVQGRFVEDLENGEVVIYDGARNWRGRPIETARILRDVPGSMPRPLEAAIAQGAA